MSQIEQTRNTTPEGQEELSERPFIAPVVDIFENDDEVLLVAELPGVKPGDVDVRLDKGELTLHARVSEGLFLRGDQDELEPVDFRRTFLVRDGIDEVNIRANLDRGLLTVHLPRSQAVKPRQIRVQSSTSG